MASSRSVVTKTLLGLIVLSVLSLLFLRTLRDSVSAPYVMRAEHLTGWRIVAAPPLGPGGPLLLLAPPRELPMELFQQVFDRTMESMNAPPSYGVTLILRSEYQRDLAPLIAAEELEMLAHEVGLASAAVEPRCLAVRRGVTAADVRSTYFVLFGLPAQRTFRERVAGLLAERGGDAAAFDPAALAPALYLAATDGGFRTWPVAGGAAEEHCVAPLETDAAGGSSG